MAEIEQVKLSEFFRSVKKPRYILGTTYTLSLAFFESVVFSCIERRDLKYCLIVTDSNGYHRALDEGAALQGAAQGYMVVPAPVPGCFHAKIWLVIGESEAALLVGSGNLTQSGFMTNVELFDSLTFSQETPPTREQFTEVTAFLSGLIGMWAEEDRTHLLCVDMLAEMRRAFGALSRANRPPEPEAPRFIHSFAGQLIAQLPEPAGSPQLLVAAPFFGNSTGGLDLLKERLSPSATHVFPAVHTNETTDFPIRQIARKKDTSVARLHVKGKKGFAHLKLYGITQEQGDSWVFCTSANCTAAAWQGPNIEAGLLRRVPAEALTDYFSADKKPLPDGTFEYKTEGDSTNRLHLWASESGMGIEITVSTNSAQHLPLKEIALTVRIGSNVATAKRATMFAGSRTEHLNWSAFEDLRRTRNMAICIELTGLDQAGQAVNGACFVENRMLLTADPIHRSAWRGALALLDTESMPDLSDIAAIFTLVNNIFDGRLVSRSPTSDKPQRKDDDEGDGDDVIHVPIWPPTADTHDLHRKIGTTGLGQLALCQKILSTLLKPQPPATTARSNQPSLDETEGDSEEDGRDTGEAQRAREETETRTKKLAQHLWDRADRDYHYLHSRLQTLCPEENVAPNIWPAAVFVFLATAAVHRATSRVAANLDDKIAMHHLIGQFVRLMLNERKQPPDFCCPKGFRYRNDDRFPPLCDDLKTTFKAEPDADLATVMVAALVAHKMQIAPNNEFPVLWRNYLRQMLGPAYEPTEDFHETSRRIWSQYLHEDTSTANVEDFDAAYDTMWQAYKGETP